MYGHSPDTEHPLWVAVLSDRPAGVVLERLGFRHVPHAAGEMYIPPPDDGREMTTLLHLASFAIFVKEEFSVLYTDNHPALPAEQIDALLRLQAEENGSDIASVCATSTLVDGAQELAQRVSPQLRMPASPQVAVAFSLPGLGLPLRFR